MKEFLVSGLKEGLFLLAQDNFVSGTKNAVNIQIRI